jgi:hypothetical protein
MSNVDSQIAAKVTPQPERTVLGIYAEGFISTDPARIVNPNKSREGFYGHSAFAESIDKAGGTHYTKTSRDNRVWRRQRNAAGLS